MSMDFIEKWKKAPCNDGNKSQYLLCPVDSDVLHAVYPPLNRKQLKELFKSVAKSKVEATDCVDSYKSFLAKTNGAELYGGSVVLFGYAAKGVDGNEDGLPASILDQNATDAVSKMSAQVLYVGNAMYSAKENIHFYLNLISGLVAGAVDGQIVIQWANFDAFLKHVQQVYDSNYSTETGRHMFYNQREKGVVHNIQFFELNT